MLKPSTRFQEDYVETALRPVSTNFKNGFILISIIFRMNGGLASKNKNPLLF